MQIHPVNHPAKGGNSFCGPAAISIITGMETGEAARLIRATSHSGRSVKGTCTGELMRAFKKCGVRMISLLQAEQADRPTLTQWLRNSQKLRTPGRVFLVDAGHHWQIITGRRFCCGRVREIVSIKDKRANRRARVAAVYELLADGKITIPDEARKNATGAAGLYEKTCRDRLKRAEKEHGVKGRLEWNFGVQDYVIDPCPLFPRGFSIVHYNWPETFEKFDFFANDYSAYDDSADEDGHISF